MTKVCVDCAVEFAVPRHGYGPIVRCKACQAEAKRLSSARSLQSPQGRWYSGQYSAHQRGIEWTLTVAQLAELNAQPCTYCNRVVENASGCGLDRLDNALGYILENITPCCWPCNRMRQAVGFSPSEMKLLGPTLSIIWQTHPVAAPGAKGSGTPAQHR